MSRSLSAAIILVLRHARWSAEEARGVLEAVGASGLSIAAFAREHDVDAQRLYAWRRRLDASATASRPSSAPLRFVELAAPAPAAPAPGYQIHFPSGVTLRIEGPVDPTEVGTLLTLLTGGRVSC